MTTMIDETSPAVQSREAIMASGYGKRLRVQAALAGKPVDRPPVTFWNHSQPGKSAASLANAALGFCGERFDLDIIKVMGDIRYPMPVGAIAEPAQWRALEYWGRENDFTRAYVSAVRQIRAIVGPAYPVVVTIYSSIQWAFLFVKGAQNFVRHFEEAPTLVHEGMANVALNMRDLAQACLDAGADGVFVSTIGCDDTVPAAIYREISRPYDLMILNAAKNGWLNVLHVHSDLPSIRLEDMLDYPIHALSWATTTTGRSLADLRQRTSLCLMGGWDHNAPCLTAPDGSPDAKNAAMLALWQDQARAAIAEASGGGLILAPGCSIPNHSTHGAMTALRQSVDNL